MAVPKPTDPVDWAESNTTPGDVTNPTLIRANGWSFESPLPFNYHNFLLRSLGRAATFLYALFSSVGDLTLGAANGYVRLVSDPATFTAGAVHVYRHVATGFQVRSRWESDVVRGIQALLAGNFSYLREEQGDADFSQLLHYHGGNEVAQFVSGSLSPADGAPDRPFVSHVNALYLNNLLKVSGTVRIDWDGSGVPEVSIVTADSYNLSACEIVDPSSTFTRRGISIDVIDTFDPRTVTASVNLGYLADGLPLMARVSGIAGSPSTFRVALSVFVSGDWEDALVPSNALSAGLANLYVTIGIQST